MFYTGIMTDNPVTYLHHYIGLKYDDIAAAIDESGLSRRYNYAALYLRQVSCGAANLSPRLLGVLTQVFSQYIDENGNPRPVAQSEPIAE
jgi:hypothetical protein